jgi:hypothetical protein
MKLHFHEKQAFKVVTLSEFVVQENAVPTFNSIVVLIEVLYNKIVT